MSLRIAAALVWLAAQASCEQPSPSPYGHLARRLNPTLAALRPAANIVLSASRAGERSDAEVVSACVGADRLLWELETARFDESEVPAGNARAPLSADVDIVLSLEWPSRCGPTSDPRPSNAACRRDCVEAWSALAKAVDRLSDAALLDGIFIVRLSA